MPFEALPDCRQAYLLQKLAAVSDMLNTEQKWCKNRLHGPNGSRCLVAALYDARARLVLYHPLLRAVREVTGIRYHRLNQFNDATGTRFDTVQAVLDRARLEIAIGVLPHGFGYALQYKAARIMERPTMAAARRL